MGQRIRAPPSSTPFPQHELHLSSLLHCPSLPVTSLGDGSSAGFMCIFQVFCCGLAGCHQGYFGVRVMFRCPICSPSPGSSSYLNTMQLFLGKGWQIENSEHNEARTPAGSATSLQATHLQLCLDFGAGMISCQLGGAVVCIPAMHTPATTSK